MQAFTRGINRLTAALLGWKPAPHREGIPGTDWLPPVLGPGDWSSSVMASLADQSAAWYFDRAA